MTDRQPAAQIVKLAQYLSSLTVQQDLWQDTGEALVRLFGVDLFALGEREPAGGIVLRAWMAADPNATTAWSDTVAASPAAVAGPTELAPALREAMAETIESGFLSTRIDLGTFGNLAPLALAILPITKENQVVAAMMIGHRQAVPLTHERLDLYLAVAGLVGTAATRLASERELRAHRQHLAELVQERTAALSATNRQLQLEVGERMRNEAIMAARLRLIAFAQAHGLSDLLRATLDEAEALTDSGIGFFHFLAADQRTLLLQSWSTNTVARQCRAPGAGEHYPVDEAGVWVDCIRSRRAVIHNDYAALPHRKGLPPGHAMVVRELVVPVQRGDLIMAILGVGNKPSDYTAEDTNAVAALADFVWDIVEGKRADEALRESEDRLRVVIASNLDGMIVVDQAGLIRMGNPAAEVLLRRPLADLIGQPFGVPIADTATEIDMAHADGQIGTLDMRVSTMAWMGNPAFLVSLRDSTERKRLQERLRHQATTDELTGVSNRRHFLELATREMKRTARLRRRLSLALIDLDHFKQINDTHGHAAGDRTLIALTQVCRRNIREIDVFARFGGDEFALLLPETYPERALEVVERVRQALAAEPMAVDDTAVWLTISVGIASSSGDSDALDGLLGRAYRALYRAKEAGRNSVAVE